MDPMKFVEALSSNMLPQDISFSIQSPDAKIRANAKTTALQSIAKLKAAGVKNTIIFCQLCTTVIMLYAVGKLSLLDHRDIMKEYVAAIWTDKQEKIDSVYRQMIIEMSVVKSKASQETQEILSTFQSAATE